MAEEGRKIDRRRNFIPWVGFFVVLTGLLSYIPFFVRFPVTRDVPWANLVLFVVGIGLIGVGLHRAFRKPAVYRGKVSSTILAILGVTLFGFFVFSVFYEVRKLPPSTGAPRVGQKAPDFTLLDKDGNPVTLSKLLTHSTDAAQSPSRTNGVVLIFYRGYW